MTTIGDNYTEPSCFPPLPDFLGGRDWCKAPGSTTPPPWGDNETRGNQTAAGLPPGAAWIIYGGLALLVFWLAVRAFEAYAALKKS